MTGPSENKDTIAQRNGFIDRMSDVQHGFPAVFRQLTELGPQRRAGNFIEMAEGLVRQQNGGIAGQRPSQSDALAHAAGQFVRVGVFEPAEPEALQKLPRISFRSLSRLPIISIGTRTLSMADRHGSKRSL